jgi:murein L,D-transpeptidase YafK
MFKSRRNLLIYAAGVAAGCALAAWRISTGERSGRMSEKPTYTVEQRIAQFGPDARVRWRTYFEKAGVSYPPERVVLLGLKLERLLHVYAAGPDGRIKLVRTIVVQGASGHLGPKLREGDKQVPEGVYEIEYLEPNSRHDVALKLNYPNGFDLARAAEEGRTEPGSFIMIHGSNTSIGCLAVGDEPSIDLWVLAADVGVRNVQVIISPVDFRQRQLPEDRSPSPEWIEGIYERLRTELSALPR